MRLTRFWILGLLSLACGASGQALIATNRVVRTLSLDECIQLALQHNLSIEVERHNPNISRYQLAGSYGIYDPVVGARYDHTYNSEEGRFDPNIGGIRLANISHRDEFTGAAPGGQGGVVTGFLPTGMSYDLGLNFAHSYGTDGSGNKFDNYTSLANFALSQPLLKNFWIDEGRLTIKLNKLNVKSSEFFLEDVVRQVVRDVQVGYYELIFAQDDVKVQEKALELADALVAQNREKVRVGTLAPLDERQAESQAAAAKADLIQAQRRLVVAENVVKNLITDSYGAWVNTALQPGEKLVAVPELFSLPESWSSAFTKRPDYLAKVLEAEKQGLTLKLAYNQLFPELNLIGGYGRNGLDGSKPGYSPNLGNALGDIRDGNNPRWNAGFIVTMPLSRKTERSRYGEEKEVKKRIDVEIRKLFQDIQLDVENTIVQAKGEYERVGATHQARVYAEEALAAEQTKLENGKSTSFNVLQLQKDLTTARSLEIRALANYNQALAVLYYRDGTVLERAKITVIK